MRWEDEHWVKLYTRDTLDWEALGWEAQALWFFVFRRLDTSGVLDLGKKGTKGLAAALGMPVDVFTRALSTLLEDGCLALRGNLIVMPNYVEAQEARKSDRQRQRDSRTKARDLAMSQDVTEIGETVTPIESVSRERSVCHVSTATVPEERRIDESSVDPLSGSSFLSASDPDRARTRSNGNAKSAHDWLTYFNARFFATRGKQRGCAADAKATADMQDQLDHQGDAERSEDWEARERIVDEFLARTDRRTAEAGWQFAFFVSSYDGLRIPPGQRPAAPDKKATGHFDTHWREKLTHAG